MPPENPLVSELIEDLALTGDEVAIGGVGWVLTD